ncbi:MAG TPA: hypothetical protein PK020_08440 [Ilumatobacteraceae bacterium]|nr:hypothetical protein [Ilumatobacteraceae bacterium]HQZ34440.1 hypothetical protein [Ilumatobacteraceae bacterium]
MNDLEEQVTERFNVAARALEITPPPTCVIVERVARRRRRRLAVRGAAGITTAVLMVGGLVLITTRGDGSPSTSGSEPQQSDSISSQPLPGPTAGTSLDITNTTAATDQWSRLPDNELTARSEHLVVATDTGLFVWGGYDAQSDLTDGAYYDDTTRIWRTLPPAPLASDRGDALGVWTGTEVVVINGISGNVKSAALNPGTFTWRTLSDPPVDNAANGSSQAVFVDGTVLLFSVFEDGAAAQNQVARLNLQSGYWTVVPSPPVSLRSGVGVVAAGSEAIVVGQSNSAYGCNVLHVLAYSPSANSWRELSAGPVATRADTVTAWTGSELFIGGGESCDNGVATGDLLNQASLLDPSTGAWRSASPAPVGFYSSYRYPDIWTGTSVATIAPDGSPLLYNPTTDTWHLGPKINGTQPILPNQTPIVDVNGTVVVSGGLISQAGQTQHFRGTYAYTIPDGF